MGPWGPWALGLGLGGLGFDKEVIIARPKAAPRVRARQAKHNGVFIFRVWALGGPLGPLGLGPWGPWGPGPWVLWAPALRSRRVRVRARKAARVRAKKAPHWWN